MITFLDLPPEIMDLIASHLLHLDVAQLNILDPAPDPDPEGEEHPLTVTISSDDGAGTIVSFVYHTIPVWIPFFDSSRS